MPVFLHVVHYFNSCRHAIIVYRMHRRHVFNWAWPLCWPWQRWCRQPMRHCRRYRTSNRSMSISVPVSWWCSLHCSNMLPSVIWESELRCERQDHNRWQNNYKIEPCKWSRWLIIMWRLVEQWDHIHFNITINSNHRQVYAILLIQYRWVNRRLEDVIR